VCLDESQDWQTLDNLTALVLGHGRFWGGGYQILPQADPTDGLMDVVALQGLGLSDFIRKGMRNLQAALPRSHLPCYYYYYYYYYSGERGYQSAPACEPVGSCGVCRSPVFLIRIVGDRDHLQASRQFQ
jgi:hypothetical protein